jgi:superfamily II DNA/RNA helicase
MDFPAVGHVVLFDFPRDGVEYVRRVGRATRGGRAPGRVTSLALGRQLPYAKALMTANAKGERIDMDTHTG